MEIKKYELQSPKEIYEVGVAVGAMLQAIGRSLLDGFQPGEDIPVMITAAITNLGAAIQGANLIGGEFKEMPVQATMGLINPIMEGIEDMIKLKK